MCVPVAQKEFEVLYKAVRAALNRKSSVERFCF